MFDSLKKFLPARKPKGATHVFTRASLSGGDQILRPGRWVFVPEYSLAGILIEVSSYPFVRVMLTNEAGENYRAENFAVANIRLARLAEIPAARRPTPVDGAKLGYF